MKYATEVGMHVDMTASSRITVPFLYLFYLRAILQAYRFLHVTTDDVDVT